MLAPLIANLSGVRESPRRHQASTITLGPASLSYPELAQALTKAGMPTEASPALAERAAFVLLRDRKPEVVRSLLGEALGVAFQASGGGWRMVIDPPAKERERLFLIQYRRQAAERAHAWAATQDALRAGRSYAALDREVRATLMTATEFASPTPALKARLRRTFALADGLKPSGWTAVADLREGSTIGPAIESPVVRNESLAEFVRDSGLPIGAVAFPARAPVSIQTIDRYDPRTGLLRHEVDGLFPDPPNPPALGELGQYNFRLGLGDVGFDNVASGPTDVRVEGVTLTETFNRMGQAAGDYLRSFDPPPTLPVTPVAAGPMPSTLSSVLERLGVEAAMELSPRFEDLPVRETPPTLSLRDALAIPAFPTAPSRVDVPRWLDEIANPEDRASVAARARSFPWRVRAREGAFLLIDPVAFLDRAQWISPVPYLFAERILASIPADGPRDRSGSRLSDWAHLEALAATGLKADSPPYRGVAVEGFGTLIPIARLVGAIPADARAAFWRQAAAPGGATASVSGGTLTLTAERWGSEYGYDLPVARVTAHWADPKGETIVGSGTLDPQGIFP